MPLLAILDRDGVIAAFENVSAQRWGAPEAGEVPVPDGCDLEPGRYRWDGTRFSPVNVDVFGMNGPRASLALAEGMAFLVDFVPAVVATMKALDAHPQMTLPPKAADWLADWESGAIEPPKSLLKWIRRYKRLHGLGD